MKLWIARDKYNNIYRQGCLTLHLYKPILNNYGRWEDNTTYGFIYILSKDEFSEITFENSPQEVELKLIRNENRR